MNTKLIIALACAMATQLHVAAQSTNYYQVKDAAGIVAGGKYVVAAYHAGWTDGAKNRVVYLDPTTNTLTTQTVADVTGEALAALGLTPEQAQWTLAAYSADGVNCLDHAAKTTLVAGNNGYFLNFSGDATAVTGTLSATKNGFHVLPISYDGKEGTFNIHYNCTGANGERKYLAINSDGTFGLGSNPVTIYNAYTWVFRFYTADAWTMKQAKIAELNSQIESSIAELGPIHAINGIEEIETQSDEFSNLDAEFDGLADAEAVVAKADEISARIAAAYEAKKSNLWAQLDGKVILLKNNRSQYYMTASSAGTLLGDSNISAEAFWTLKKVEGKTSHFKLYNETSGQWFSSTEAATKPAKVGDEASATEFVFEGYNDSNIGKVALAATTHTSGNVYLHVTNMDVNSMYYTKGDAGSPFHIVWIDEVAQELVNSIGDNHGSLDSEKFGTVSDEVYNQVVELLNDHSRSDHSKSVDLYNAYLALQNPENAMWPVFMINARNGFNSLSAGAANTTYTLTDPLDYRQYWVIEATSKNVPNGAFTVRNLATGVTITGQSGDINFNADGTINSLSIAGNDKWDVVYVGNSADFKAQHDAFAAYAAGNLPKARFIACHIGSGLGEYTLPANASARVAEDFQAHTADLATYTANKEAADAEAATLVAATLNMPSTGSYIRIKAGKNRSAEIDKTPYMTSANSTRTGSTTRAAFAADKDGENEASTIFFLADNNRLIGYDNGRFVLNNSNFAGFSETDDAAQTAETGTQFNFAIGRDGMAGDYAVNFNGTARALYCNSYAENGTVHYVADAGSGAPSNAGYMFGLEEVESLPVTLQGGYATLSAPVMLRIPAGVTCFATKREADVLTMKELSADATVAANTALLIVGTDGAKVNFPIAYGVETADVADFTSAFTGSTFATAITPAEGEAVFAYVPETNDAAAVAGMRKAADANTARFTLKQLSADENGRVAIAANQALLKVAADAAAITEAGTLKLPLTNGATFDLNGEDGTTGISAISVEQPDGTKVVYDLHGRKVIPSAPGIYIVDGKKIFLK